MTARTRRMLFALLAGMTMAWLADAGVAAQQQPRRPQPKQDVPLIDQKAVPCDELINVHHKQNITALPANVIEPKQSPEGWPDLQGNWSNNDYIGGSGHSVEVGFDPAGFVLECWDPKSNMGSILIDPMKGQIPYNAEGQKHRDQLLAALYAPTRRIDQEPTDLCMPNGVPRSNYGGAQIRYTPGHVVLMSGKNTRVIPMDGSPHLSGEVKLYMGDSRGHFEGNTLVVETTNNREGTWFDVHGTFHSDQLKVTEKWTMIDQNKMYHEIIVEDPKVFSRPWKMATTLERTTGGRGGGMNTQEAACHEGERDIDHATAQGLRANVVGWHGYHIHVDLATGKAIVPFEQHYLDESGQPRGHSFAPTVSDEEVAQAAKAGKRSDAPAKPSSPSSKPAGKD